MNFGRVLLVLAFAPVASAAAAGLGGSRASMRRQHEVARQHDFTFLRTAAQVRDFARADRLERLTGNANYDMGRVAFPYARPAVKLFIERLADQFRAATGERLVVTSLTRPLSRQPRNASPLSVHPAGMAVDFRIPARASSRRWLENTLLSLEETNVLDVTRERRPAHYHVAVFPDEYEAYVAMLASYAVATTANKVLGVLPAIPTPAIAAVEPLAIPDASLLPLAAIAALGLAGIMALAGFNLRRKASTARETSRAS